MRDQVIAIEFCRDSDDPAVRADVPLAARLIMLEFNPVALWILQVEGFAVTVVGGALQGRLGSQ